MKKIFYCLLLFILATTTTLTAAPTIYGPSGLVTIPTAEALKYKEFNIAYDNLFNGSSETNEFYYKVNLGSFKGCELGIVGGTEPSEGVFLNAKYYLMSSNDRYPLSIAIGAENLTSTARTGIYMVATQRFEGGFIGSVGFKATLAEEELDPSIMGGLEYILNNKISILGDFVGERKLYMINAGVRMTVFNNLVVRAYAIDIGQNRNEIFYSLGISYAKFL